MVNRACLGRKRAWVRIPSSQPDYISDCCTSLVVLTGLGNNKMTYAGNHRDLVVIKESHMEVRCLPIRIKLSSRGLSMVGLPAWNGGTRVRIPPFRPDASLCQWETAILTNSRLGVRVPHEAPFTPLAQRSERLVDIEEVVVRLHQGVPSWTGEIHGWSGGLKNRTRWFDSNPVHQFEKNLNFY